MSDKSYTFDLPKNSVAGGIYIPSSVGGNKSLTLMVDTASIGIVLAEQYLNGAKFTDTGKPFQITYSSSGNSYKGTWISAEVTIGEPGSVQATTKLMNVRRATKWREGWNGSFKPDNLVVSMLGVGFDRPGEPGMDDVGGNITLPDINDSSSTRRV